MMNIIIADDSDVVRKVAKRILNGLNFEVTEARSINEAIVLCTRDLPRILIVDSALEGALDLISFVRTLPGNENTRIYYSIIEADLKHMMQGKRAGANDFLLKPFDRKTLTAAFGAYANAA